MAERGIQVPEQGETYQALRFTPKGFRYPGEINGKPIGNLAELRANSDSLRAEPRVRR